MVLDAPFVATGGPDSRFYRPQNYSERFYGLSTLRLGLEYSRNVMTVRLAQEMGMENLGRSRKQEIIANILRKHAKGGEAIYGDGTLEILQDGFGFL